MRLIAIEFWIMLCLADIPAMTNSRSFVCVNEEDHLPLLDSQTDTQYHEATALVKPDTLQLWGCIVELYSKVVEHDHWKVTHNLASLYRTKWPGGIEKGTQKVLGLYQKMVDPDVPQRFYDMEAMIGNCARVENPATDGLTFFDKAANLENPPALTEPGKLYIYVAKKKDLGLTYTHYAASRDYASAGYELEAYYKIIEHNSPKAPIYYQVPASQGGKSAAFFLSRVFGSEIPPASAMWYALDEELRKAYYSTYKKLEADPDLRFPNPIEDYPLPPHPIQGYNTNRPGWKPER